MTKNVTLQKPTNLAVVLSSTNGSRLEMFDVQCFDPSQKQQVVQILDVLYYINLALALPSNNNAIVNSAISSAVVFHLESNTHINSICSCHH